MSKRIAMLMSGLIGLAILAGCAAKPAFYECSGNNCRHGYEHSAEIYAA